MVKKPTKNPELPGMTVETQEFFRVNGRKFESRLEAEQHRTQLLIEEKFEAGDAEYGDFPEWLTKNAFWVIETLKEMLDRVEKAG